MHNLLLSTKQVIVRITGIIAMSEFVIMLIINFAPIRIDAFSEAAIDVTLLALISTPSIYLWVIQPFVNARDEALAQVKHLAFTDPLTHVSNRRHLLHHLERVIASSSRHKIYGALLLIDLDGFKAINDLHGHDAGDAVLVEIAKRLRASSRTEEIVSRLGGDEFVVLLDQLDIDEQQARNKALHIADKFISLASTPVDYHGHPLQVGTSIGINLIRFNHKEADAIIREADIAMYRTKNSGKGHATFFD